MSDLAAQPESPRRRALWPALVSPLVAVGALFAGAAAAQVAILAVFAAQAAADEDGPVDMEAALQQLMERPIVLAVVMLCGQLALLLSILVLGVVSRVRFRERLGLVRPSMAGWAWALLVPANLFVWLVASLTFSQIFPEPGEHLENLTETVMRQGPVGKALLLIGAAMLPGIGEELVSRGYLLRRLLWVWGRKGAAGLLAVLITSCLFALMHMDPFQAALIFPLGLWWSFVAWRTGSSVPAIVLHVFNNAWVLILAWVVYGSAGGAASDPPPGELLAMTDNELTLLALAAPAGPPIVFLVALGLGLPAFIASVLVLMRQAVPEHAEA